MPFKTLFQTAFDFDKNFTIRKDRNLWFYTVVTQYFCLWKFFLQCWQFMLNPLRVWEMQQMWLKLNFIVYSALCIFHWFFIDRVKSYYTKMHKALCTELFFSHWQNSQLFEQLGCLCWIQNAWLCSFVKFSFDWIILFRQLNISHALFQNTQIILDLP